MNMLHCMVCHDKDKARMKKDDAMRILLRIKQLCIKVEYKGYNLKDMPQKSYLHITPQHKRSLCQDHCHCMCGSCHEVDQHMRTANRYNEEIAENVISLHYFLLYVKDIDKNIYGDIKHSLMTLLSGFYPKAASIINRS